MGETVGETMGETVGETANKILKYLQTKPHVTRTELAELLGLSIRGVEYNIKVLKESGNLIFCLPPKVSTARVGTNCIHPLASSLSCIHKK